MEGVKKMAGHNTNDQRSTLVLEITGTPPEPPNAFVGNIFINREDKLSHSPTLKNKIIFIRFLVD